MARRMGGAQRYPSIATRNSDGFRCALPILRNRLQPCLDRSPSRLQKRRQRQLFTERLHRLVRRKSRAIGRDLEQYPVGLTEIEAAEIEAVDLAAVGNAQVRQALRPGVILRLIRRAE